MNQTPQLDAIRKYLIEQLAPQTRLDYLLLSHTDRIILRAMCSFSWDGIHLKKSLQDIADRAGVHRDTVRRALNGYVGSKNVRFKGFIARSLIEVETPADLRRCEPAKLAIRWDRFVVDPQKRGYIEARLQQSLPGIPAEANPAEKPVDLLRTGTGNPAAPSPHSVGSLPAESRGTLPAPCGDPPRTVRDEELCSFLNSYALFPSVQQKPSDPNLPLPVQKAGSKLNSKKSAWERLHHGFRRRVEAELDLLWQARIGTSFHDWTPHEIANEHRRLMLLACHQVGIWPHVADALAAEEYDLVFAQEQKKRSAAAAGGSTA